MGEGRPDTQAQPNWKVVHTISETESTNSTGATDSHPTLCCRPIRLFLASKQRLDTPNAAHQVQCPKEGALPTALSRCVAIAARQGQPIDSLAIDREPLRGSAMPRDRTVTGNSPSQLSCWDQAWPEGTIFWNQIYRARCRGLRPYRSPTTIPSPLSLPQSNLTRWSGGTGGVRSTGIGLSLGPKSLASSCVEGVGAILVNVHAWVARSEGRGHRRLKPTGRGRHCCLEQGRAPHCGHD